MEVVLRTSVAYTERSKCEHTDHLPDPRSAARRQRWGGGEAAHGLVVEAARSPAAEAARGNMTARVACSSAALLHG